jgi:hypothetical protein
MKMGVSRETPIFYATSKTIPQGLPIFRNNRQLASGCDNYQKEYSTHKTATYTSVTINNTTVYLRTATPIRPKILFNTINAS